VIPYEVFLRKLGRDPFTHAGTLMAPDDEMALVYARETYTRRGEGDEIWVVRREHVLRAGADFLWPTTQRHHSSNDGALVAARRRSRRSSTNDQP